MSRIMTHPGVYKHAKGGFYQVLFSAVEATNDGRNGTWNVIYVCLKSGGIFTRSEAEFHELVEPTPDQGYLEGVKVPRFQFVYAQLNDKDAESLYDDLLETFGRKP